MSSFKLTLPILPIPEGETQDFVVEWEAGDESSREVFKLVGPVSSPDVSHDYDSSGVKSISIYALPDANFGKYWAFGSSGVSGSGLKVISNWGPFEFAENGGAFVNCASLDITASDNPAINYPNSLKEAFMNCMKLSPGVNAFANWDTSLAESLEKTFMSCHLFNGSVSSWDVSNVTTTKSMFYGASSFNQPFGGWNGSSSSTSNLVDASEMFLGASSFNQNLSDWNTSSLEKINTMFTSTTSFNSPVFQWDSSTKAIDNINMLGVFSNSSFNDSSISSWNVSNVKNLSSVFHNASSFNQDISSWNTSSAVNTSSMLKGASSFNQDLSNWDVDQVTLADGMLEGAGLSEQTVSDIAANWAGQGGAAAEEAVAEAPFAPTTKAELQTAVDAWIADESAALVTYGDINTWNTSNITDMRILFSGKETFNSDISSWNTGNVTDMNSMFAGCKQFNQDIGGWNTSNVELMYGMFSANEQFNQDISSWDTSKVTRMDNMFSGAENFNQDISSWNTGNVVNMNNMFRQAFNFNQNIGNWDTRNVTHMQNMFTGARSFDQNIGTWDISSLDSGGLQFFCQNKYEPFATSNYDAILIGWSTLSGSETQIPINVSVDFYNSQYSTTGESARNKLINDYNWSITDGGLQAPAVFTPTTKAELQTAVDAYCADNAAGQATYGHISTWNVSSVTNMYELFKNKTTFNSDIGGWDVSNVTSMSRMFQSATSFNAPLSLWDTSNVTNMNSMFQNAEAFNQDVRSWDVSSVTNMSRMFNGAYVFNQPVGLWGQKTINVTDTSHMFAYARSFNQPIGDWNMQSVQKINNMFQGEHYDRQPFNGSIASWNLSNCIEMSTVFEYCDFNQPLNTWNTSQVTTMSQMFANAQNFDQDISSWNTSNVTSFFNMFRATPFNQNISSWNTSSATTMSYMFMDTAHFNQPIGVWNTSSLLTADGMFSNAASFNQDLSNWDISALTGSTANAFLSNVTLSSNNYDSLLNGWSTVSAGEAQIPTNVNFHAGYSQYSSAGEAARDLLVNTFGWIITDGGKNDDWIRAGSVHSPTHSAYGSNAQEDWRLASWNDEDLWRFQQQLPGQDITYNGTVYSGGNSVNSLNGSLVTAVGSYNNASLGGSTVGGSHSRILVKQTENGNYPVLTGWPSKDYLVEIKVGNNIRWGTSDPGIGGKLEASSETVVFTLDDSAFPDSVGDGWYFIDSHNTAASGTNKVFKIDSQGQIIRVINCVDIFSNTDLVEPSFAAQFTIS